MRRGARVDVGINAGEGSVSGLLVPPDSGRVVHRQLHRRDSRSVSGGDELLDSERRLDGLHLARNFRPHSRQ